MDSIIPLLPAQRLGVNANKPINNIASLLRRINFIAPDRQGGYPRRHLQTKIFARGHGGENFFLTLEREIGIFVGKEARNNRGVIKRLATAGIEQLEVVVDEFPKLVQA